MSHPNALEWWKSLKSEDKEYWTNRFNTDPKEGSDLTYEKEEYCYRVMLWERADNGSC